MQKQDFKEALFFYEIRTGLRLPCVKGAVIIYDD